MNTNVDKMTFEEMALAVESIWKEVKRRNPIGVNIYGKPFGEAAFNLREIGEAEKENPSCEAGPGVDTNSLATKIHWKSTMSVIPFCGAKYAVDITRDKTKITCSSCRKLMKLHGYLEAQ